MKISIHISAARPFHASFTVGLTQANRPVSPRPCPSRRSFIATVHSGPIHSHFPLQVERLVHIVMTTAQVDKGDVAADGHFLLVFLLQLKGPLQVLITQQQDVSGVGETSGSF